MRVDYLVLADAVSVAEGKHYIHGGGWDVLFVPSLPAIHPMLGIAVKLRIPWEETGQQLALEVDVIGSKGRNSILEEPLRGIIDAERSSDIRPGSNLLLHLAFSITNLSFESAGSYTVIMRIDGQPLAESDFDVIPLPG